MTEVTGRVRDVAGIPVPGAVVTLVDSSGQQIARGTTGRYGGYRLPAPGRGVHVLIASAPAYRPEAATVTVGGTAAGPDLVLESATGLGGVVRSATTGVPVADATVTLADARGEVVGSYLSGQGGEYSFGALPAGAYTLAVNAPGYRPVAVAVPMTDASVRQDVELAEAAVIRGSVTVGDLPRPWPRITVSLLDEAGNVTRSTYAGEDGRYAFHDLEPGTYTVVATSYAPVRQATHVGGGPARLDVRLT
ncbi:MSCRAMM family protein [Amycolatopsis ruanii]|uniref:MSCRAMM family protein n=1 Tax=Amycolatopsis ruanii TaxID=944491 RepID=UPI000E25FC22|nr:carboxypeptidase regulatory-like domain-containing protein [Amycolatopsis ruanii]